MLPFSAAERRQNVATAEGRGFRLGKTKPRQGRKTFQARQSFAPDGNERRRMQARQRAAIKIGFPR
ncbi:MAG: hypothetical protein DMG13_04010 [Acidobacteria bacterium]|nr:MAG: hypothetical protein DMG13_04010 [Acidobacteriota bacterium]